MIDLPKRSDSIYKEIEGFNEKDNQNGFKDYEYTNCIAYEMAIRNDDFILISIAARYFYAIWKILARDNIKENESLLKGTRKEYLYSRNCYKEIISKIIKKYKMKENDNLVEEARDTFFYLSDYLSEIFLINYHDFITFCNSKSTQIERKFLVKIGESEYKYINHDRVLNIKISNGIEFTTQIISNCEGEVNWIDIEMKAEPIYSRPKLEIINSIELDTDAKELSKEIFKKAQAKEVTIQINPNLPKDELIAYISKIKDEYDKDKLVVKSALELLGEDFEKADGKHIQKKPKGEKWADWFFIYDCFKMLKANRTDSNDTLYGEIDLLLLEYYNSEKDDYYSIETYRQKILKNMIYLIDKLGYRELITGVSNKTTKQ